MNAFRTAGHVCEMPGIIQPINEHIRIANPVPKKIIRTVGKNGEGIRKDGQDTDPSGDTLNGCRNDHPRCPVICNRDEDKKPDSKDKS